MKNWLVTTDRSDFHVCRSIDEVVYVVSEALRTPNEGELNRDEPANHVTIERVHEDQRHHGKEKAE